MERKKSRVVNDKQKALTQDDYHLIRTIVLGWFFLHNVLMKLSPEDFAEKVFLKVTSSEKRPATIRLLFDLIREKSNPIVSPQEFNKKLAKETLDKSAQDMTKDIMMPFGDRRYDKQYLHAPRMSEILQYLKDRGLLEHIEGKKAIKKEIHRLPGKLEVKRDSSDIFGERFNGKPSAYKKTETVDKLAKLLQKAQARSIVYEILKRFNILYEHEKFMLSAFFIALKRSKPIDISRNDSLAQKVIKATNGPPVEERKIKSLQDQLIKLDENQVKQLAAERAMESIERQKNDAYFLTGLFRI